MTEEEQLAALENKLRSIPGWLTVVVLLSEINKLKMKVAEKFLPNDGYTTKDSI